MTAVLTEALTALIHAPTGRDAVIVQRLLSEADIVSVVCSGFDDIKSRVDETTLFIIVAEEGLKNANLRPLSETLAIQPPWSDLPVIILTLHGGTNDRNPLADRLLSSLGNISFLERPFHPTTLVSLARSAVRARKRQFAMRDNLDQLKRSRDAMRDSDFRLRESEATFRAMFANSSLGKFQIDAVSGEFIRGNDALCRIVGYSEPELLLLRDANLCFPGEPPSDWSLEGLFLNDKLEIDFEKLYRRKDDSTVWVQVTLNAIRNEAGKVVRLSGVVQDITSRKQVGEQLRMLMREVNHRSKNLLAVVQSVARQTARDTSPRDFIRNFSQRLQGLSASQDLLVAGDWISVDLEALIRSQLLFLGESQDVRVKIDGAPIVVTPSVAQALGLAIHELATNAIKYGSLSVTTGEVHISWHIEEPGFFVMAWAESGGPIVREPDRIGFGTVVVERMVATSVNGEVQLRYPPSGLMWTLKADLETISSISPPRFEKLDMRTH